MSLPETHRTITGIAWRQDESTAVTESIIVPGAGVTIIMSSTTADELAPRYADNHGNDQTVVFDGATAGEVLWQLNDTGPGPRDFEFIIPFTTPFTYDPTLGRNLLLHFIDTSAAGRRTDALIDRQSTNATTHQAGHDLTVSEATRRFVWVTQFTFVPEPSTSLLATLGFLAVALWRRRSLSAV